METLIVFFLAVVTFHIIINTILLFGTYKRFARVTLKVTESVSDVRRNTSAREWIKSMQIAAERAAVLTESTKLRLAEFDPVLGRAHENYRLRLVAIDSKLEGAAAKISTGAKDVRDKVAKPAFSVATFAAGVARALEAYEREE